MLISLDHDQLEPRIQAHIYSNLGDESWADIYWFKEEWERKHPGKYNPRADIYALVGSMAYQHKLLKIDSKKHPVRKNSKPIVLGMSYGLTAYGLAWRIGCSETEAAQIIKRLFKNCPGMADYFDLTRDEIASDEKVETMFGLVRHLPYKHFKTARERRWAFQKAFRRGINVKIQGPGSDITLSGMVDFEEKYNGLSILSRKTPYILVAEVHDSLDYDATTKKLIKALKYHMTNPSILDIYDIELNVPLRVDEKISNNWS